MPTGPHDLPLGRAHIAVALVTADETHDPPFEVIGGVLYRRTRDAAWQDGIVPVHSIDHVQLAMPAGGEERARWFYGEVLGLPEAPKPPHLARRGGCWFETPTIKIHLGVEADFRPARKAHPALLVTELAALVRELQDAGIEIVDDEPLQGYERVYVHDPFGNRLELLEPSTR